MNGSIQPAGCSNLRSWQNPLIHAAADTEDQHRDNQRPEVQLLAVSKWMGRIRGLFALAYSFACKSEGWYS
jgi:hypothetical protein